ncbi:hypothetical protein DERF_007953 [Dermatophagoides farinae]|uniref:Uncharacterized protein n=1 Tax=Dermatophagoides farinae TaxID=6954 RepID=A0A922I1G3_DERFA|nr:hypothetical protein DERF_007953 [Dermatophagoides farinae]
MKLQSSNQFILRPPPQIAKQPQPPPLSSSLLLLNLKNQSSNIDYLYPYPYHFPYVIQTKLKKFRSGRKRRPTQPQQQQQQQQQTIQCASTISIGDGSSEDVVMDECAAALVLMSLSASPRSPTLFTAMMNEQQQFQHRTTPTKLFKCTWRGCKHRTFVLREIEQHVRLEHLQKYTK